MNLLHMKYAVEVARLGSLNRAAEALMVAQPNISRSIKELEGDLGITIFYRSAKGMTLTPDGEEFMERARDILGRIEQIEQTYSDHSHKKRRFSVILPIECDFSSVLTEFSRSACDGEAELFFEQCDARRAMQKLLDGESKLAVISYPACYDSYYRAAIEEKGLCCEDVAEYTRVLLMSQAHPLAASERIASNELSQHVEIAFPAPCVPSLSYAKVLREEFPDAAVQRIFVNDRATRFELLAADPLSFAWSSPCSGQTLSRYGLVERACDEAKRCKTVLLSSKGYKHTALDRSFIAALRRI